MGRHISHTLHPISHARVTRMQIGHVRISHACVTREIDIVRLGFSFGDFSVDLGDFLPLFD